MSATDLQSHCRRCLMPLRQDGPDPATGSVISQKHSHLTNRSPLCVFVVFLCTCWAALICFVLTDWDYCQEHKWRYRARTIGGPTPLPLSPLVRVQTWWARANQRSLWNGGRPFLNIISGMTWGDLCSYDSTMNGVDLTGQRSTHARKCNIRRLPRGIFIFKEKQLNQSQSL